MKLAFSIAKRFLWSGKTQTFMIILGIAIGVSVQVFIGSLINGLQDDLVNSTIGSSSQITVTRESENAYINNYTSHISTLEKTDIPFTAISETINLNGSLIKNDDSKPTLLRGFDYGKAEDIYGFEQALTEGTLPSGDNEVTIGVLLAEKLGLGVGDDVTFVMPSQTNQTFEIVGLFDFNIQSVNETWSLATLGTLRMLADLTSDQAGSIETQIGDVFAAEEYTVAIKNALPEDLSVSNWMQENAELLSGLNGQSVSSIMIQIFVMVSVVLGISSVLAITVLQKSRQIGILKAMGITDKDASLIFLSEGLILGVIGAVLGVLLGLGLGLAFQTFAVDAGGDPVVSLSIDPGFIALSATIAMLAAIVASVIPARKSSTISVIEVIRNG